MRFSVYTPTHNVRWLTEAFGSLLKQEPSYADGEPDFEWIVVPNGKVKREDVPAAIREHPKVRVIESALTGVGALKRFAAEQARGEILVELDHDDLLAADCLARLDAAARATPGGFYYSDFVPFKADGSSEHYGSAFGWERYDWPYEGETYVAYRAFAPSARSLCQIFYAPNHVRAWSAEAYRASGGYDPTLTVGDDHDLICRTYLAGAPFVHVPECLYLYRAHPENTFRVDNPAVQAQQAANMARYTYPLVYEECRRRGLPKLEVCLDHGALGPGYERFDLFAEEVGLGRRLSLDDNKYGCVWVTDTLQRVPRVYHAWAFNELHRVLAPGGWLLTKTPALDDGEGRPGRGAHQDPGHVSQWSPNNFWYFTHRDYAKHVKNYKARFQLVRSSVSYPSAWHRANLIPYVYADMIALKGRREAGLTTI